MTKCLKADTKNFLCHNLFPNISGDCAAFAYLNSDNKVAIKCKKVGSAHKCLPWLDWIVYWLIFISIFHHLD